MIITDVNTNGASSESFLLDRDEMYVHLAGTFGGASVQIEQQLEDGAWSPIVGALYTSPANDVIELGAHRRDGRPTPIRSVTSAASGTTALTLQLK